jgi:hypothetical protein
LFDLDEHAPAHPGFLGELIQGEGGPLPGHAQGETEGLAVGQGRLLLDHSPSELAGRHIVSA